MRQNNGHCHYITYIRGHGCYELDWCCNMVTSCSKSSFHASNERAMNVPFHLLYGSLICSKKLQSDRLKCRGTLADPSTSQNHAWIIAICRKISKNFNQQRTLNLLFQMKYDSLPNSEKQSSDSQRSWDNSYSLLTLVLFFPPASKTCLNNIGSHTVNALSRSDYHISFERGDLELSWNTKILKFSYW